MEEKTDINNWCIVDLVYQMLHDKERLENYKKAIEILVKPNMSVVDIGVGNGALSLFSAKAGAKIVYGIEIENEAINFLKRTFRVNGFENKIKIIHKSIFDVNPPEKVDIVVGDLISTALIDEIQVPAMNYARENLLKPNGKIMPELITSSAQLVQTNYEFFGLKFPMVQHEWEWCNNKVKDLSCVKKYHEADFSGFVEENVNKEFVFRIEKSGTINGIRLLSTIYPIKGRDDLAIGATISVCPPTIIPCEEKKVNEGDEVKVRLNYTMGRGYDSVKININ